MGADEDRLREDEALDWVRRLADPQFTDWEGHLAWLERDGRNGRAFEAASMVMEEATAVLAQARADGRATPVNDNVMVPSGRRLPYRRLGGLAAVVMASALVLFFHWPAQHPSAQRLVFATRPGQTRAIRMDDGTTISLNGDSAISTADPSSRAVRLEHGEAFFEVAPVKGRPFRVLVGDASIQDLATAFDVVRDGAAVEISVREGAVLYGSGRTRLPLAQGQALRIADHMAVMSRIEARAAGGWREGRLVYHDAPLSLLARDLQRRIGVPVVIGPDLLARRFTGVIVLGGDRALVLHRIGALLGARARPEGRGWRLGGAG